MLSLKKNSLYLKLMIKTIKKKYYMCTKISLHTYVGGNGRAAR